MGYVSEDIVPLGQVRARFSELAEEAQAGREKLITRNGEGYVALIDARKLDYYHRLEQEHIHLLLLDESIKGLDDVEQQRTITLEDFRKKHGR